MTVKPFIIPTDSSREANIKQRMADYQWPVAMQLNDGENPWGYGMDQVWLKDFCRYVVEDYKWQETVDELNRFDHFSAEIDNLNIDGSSKKIQDNFVTKFNMEKKNIFNKIVFKNIIKDFFENFYDG